MKQRQMHILGSVDLEGMTSDQVREMLNLMMQDSVARCPVCGAPQLLPRSVGALLDTFEVPFIMMDCSKCDWFLVVVWTEDRLRVKPGAHPTKI